MLERFVTQDLVNSGRDLLKATPTLCEWMTGELSNRPEVPRIVRAVCDSVKRGDGWMPFDEEAGAGVATACLLTPEKEYSSAIVTALQRSLKGTQPAGDVKAEACVGVQHVLRELKDLGNLDGVKQFRLPLSVNEWPKFCSLLRQSGDDTAVWSYMCPEVSWDEVGGFLVRAAANPPSLATLLPDLRVQYM